MGAPDEPPTPDLWDRMTAEGHAAFALALAANDGAVTNERERELVETAIAAGVVGALEVIRRDGDEPDPESG